MKLIGVTGGVGMGKSTVENFLREGGVPVVDTDAVAHALVAPGQEAWEEIRREFGAEYVTSTGLDRGRMARLVFADEVARGRLEAILHPRIRANWREQTEGWRKAGAKLGAVVIPLLYETRAERELETVICVACGAATQAERLKPRGWSAAQIAQRIASQMSIEQKMAQASYLLWNEGPVANLQSQLHRVLGRLGWNGGVGL